MNAVSLLEGPPVILVVDDDQFTRQLLRRVMEKEGYQVVEAANGEQGLEAYKRLKPHLVLLDALMPVMDGFTCCTQLQRLSYESSLDDEPFTDSKSLQGDSRTPVLMITGLNDQESGRPGICSWSHRLCYEANSFGSAAPTSTAYHSTVSAVSTTKDSQSGVAASGRSRRTDRSGKPTSV
jgi:CheY-like chemotaxis protein